MPCGSWLVAGDPDARRETLGHLGAMLFLVAVLQTTLVFGPTFRSCPGSLKSKGFTQIGGSVPVTFAHRSEKRKVRAVRAFFCGSAIASRQVD